jgi:hypothetical protein
MPLALLPTQRCGCSASAKHSFRQRHGFSRVRFALLLLGSRSPRRLKTSPGTHRRPRSQRVEVCPRARLCAVYEAAEQPRRSPQRLREPIF